MKVFYPAVLAAILVSDGHAAKPQLHMPDVRGNGNGNGNANGNGNGNSGRTAADDSAIAGIQGTYAVALNEGVGEVYALGVVDYDGSGELSGSLLFNIPTNGDSTDRTFFTTPVTGTYSEGEDGMGDQSWTYEQTPIGEVDSDILLQVAEYQGSSAIKVNAYSTNVSRFLPGGALVRYQMVARPSAGFDVSSLTGSYSVNFYSTGPIGSLNGLGQLNFGGDGNVEGMVTINDPSREGNDEERSLFPSPVDGTYSINDDGFGDLTITNRNIDVTFNIHLLIAEVDAGNVKSVFGTFVQTGPLTGGPFTIELTSLN